MKDENIMLEILHDYKRSNKAKDIFIFVLLGIIALFVGGLIYIISVYDFSYETTQTTDGGNACIGDSCTNGDLYGKSDTLYNEEKHG